jgi:predicted  nucleic acid-binding Zn-ribbon protein
LPNILALTNRLNDILDEGITAAETANKLLTSAQPVVDNLEKITDQITDPEGSLGEWLLPPDIREQLTNALAAANATLANANGTLTNVDARISALAVELERALENLSSITSNLNAQVAANPNLVKEISDAINHADELVQGLKRHWLLRSAFKNQGSDQPASRPPTSRSPSPARPRAGKPIW